MLLLTLPLLAAGVVGAAPTVNPLYDQIFQADTQLFTAAFEACDAAKAAAMTTQDMEFFHDEGGKSASNRADFQHSIATMCDDQRAGVRPRLRRALVKESLQVFPMQQDRALEMGDHRFYQRVGGGPERLTGEARFVHLWRRVEGRWELERVISYDHHGVKEKSGKED